MRNNPNDDGDNEIYRNIIADRNLELERTYAERNEYYNEVQRLKNENAKMRDAAERKVERLRNLVQTLIDNDPDEPISDAGHTVIDLWRHEARDALAETEKGDE